MNEDILSCNRGRDMEIGWRDDFSTLLIEPIQNFIYRFINKSICNLGLIYLPYVN